jgi:hypothetical protein
VIDDPGARVALGGDARGLEPDRHFEEEIRGSRVDREHLEPTVGGVDREKPRAVGGEGQGMDLLALELRVGRGARRCEHPTRSQHGDRDPDRGAAVVRKTRQKSPADAVGSSHRRTSSRVAVDVRPYLGTVIGRREPV